MICFAISAAFGKEKKSYIFLKPENGNKITENKNGVFGAVSPIFNCGGVGNNFGLRVSDCEGLCTFVPGNVYQAELDFMISTLIKIKTLKIFFKLFKILDKK